MPLADLCYTAGARRGHHDHRLSVVGDSPAAMSESLAAYRHGESRRRTLRRTKPSRPAARRGLRLLRPGLAVARHGAAAAGAGTGVPRRACRVRPRDAAVSGRLGARDLGQGRCPSTDIGVIQPAIFAVQVALAALWRSWGVEPAAVVGHSMGEVAAAHVAGALSLEDAARVICARARLMPAGARPRGHAGGGVSLAEAQELIAGRKNRSAIAASNSHRSTVLSGRSGTCWPTSWRC